MLIINDLIFTGGGKFLLIQKAKQRRFALSFMLICQLLIFSEAGLSLIYHSVVRVCITSGARFITSQGDWLDKVMSITQSTTCVPPRQGDSLKGLSYSRIDYDYHVNGQLATTKIINQKSAIGQSGTEFLINCKPKLRP